jgi:DNA-binding SARP family transcriptional activator
MLHLQRSPRGPHVTIRTLGRFRVTVDAQPLESPRTHKARALIAYLAMHARSDVARERLMEAFWPEAAPQHARDSLNTALHAIRRSFRHAGFDPDAFLSASRSTVRWLARTDLDADRLAMLEASPRRQRLRAAITAYRGEFLAGGYDDWTVEQRRWLSAAHERALLIAVRDHADVAAARKLLDLNPSDESAHFLLLEALAERGGYVPFGAPM